MIKKLIAAGVVAGAFAAAPMMAQAQDVDWEAAAAEYFGDADIAALSEDGAKVYRKCRACHELAKERNKVGPHQVGIVGRPAGAIEGFRYSKAMAESGLVWDFATLEAYLADPKGYVKGTKMAFAGLRKPEELKAVIAHLYVEGGVHEGGTN